VMVTRDAAKGAEIVPRSGPVPPLQARSRFSPLASLTLTPHLIGWEVFRRLPRSEQSKLAELLPEDDRSDECWEQVC